MAVRVIAKEPDILETKLYCLFGLVVYGLDGVLTNA